MLIAEKLNFKMTRPDLPADWKEIVGSIAAQNNLATSDVSRTPSGAVLSLVATAALGSDGERFKAAVQAAAAEIQNYLSPPDSFRVQLELARKSVDAGQEPEITGQGERSSGDTARVSQALAGAAHVRYADSVVEIRGTVGGDLFICVLTGYSSPGDGGGGVFYWSTASAQDDAGTILNTGEGKSAGWRRIYDGPLEVGWFGAYADGASGSPHDDSVAIQRALDCASSLGGGTVKCRRGRTHSIGATLAVPARVTLDVTDSTLLPIADFHLVSATGDSPRVIGGTFYGVGTSSVKSDGKAAVYVSDATNFLVSGVSIRKRKASSVDRGIDIGVQLHKCTGGKVENIYYEGGNFQAAGDCVVLTACRDIQISKVTCRDLNKVGVYASVHSGDVPPDAAGQQQNQCITISDVNVEGFSSAPYSCALQIRACAGATITNIAAKNTVYGVLSCQQYSTDGSLVVQDITFSNLISVNSTHCGFLVSGDSRPGQLRRLSFSNVRIESSAMSSTTEAGALISGAPGVAVSNFSLTNTPTNHGLVLTTEDAVLSGIHIRTTKMRGLYLYGSNGVNVTGVTIIDSNTAGAGYEDIRVTSCYHVAITGFNCRALSNSPAYVPIYVDDSNADCFVGYGVAAGHSGEKFVDNRAANVGCAPSNVLGYQTRATVGATGAADALPAKPIGYIDVYVNGTRYQTPYYPAP